MPSRRTLERVCTDREARTSRGDVYSSYRAMQRAFGKGRFDVYARPSCSQATARDDGTPTTVAQLHFDAWASAMRLQEIWDEPRYLERRKRRREK